MRHTLYEVLSDTDQSAILNIESKILDLRKDLISANDKEKKRSIPILIHLRQTLTQLRRGPNDDDDRFQKEGSGLV